MDRREFLKAAAPATVILGTPALWHRPATARAAAAGPDTLSLGGPWRFHLDPENVGREFTAWHQVEFPDRIDLPASTDEAGYGTQTTGPEFGHLSRAWRYEGLAWYQRDVDVPDAWHDKRITLFLERPHWATTVWVDDQEAGTQDSLSVPHVHDLSDLLTPGRHRLTIVVDNSYRIDVGRNAHSVTDHTQTNWNGITGRIELQATDPVWIDQVRAFPDLDGRRVRLEGTIRNVTGGEVAGELTAVVTPPTGGGARKATQRIGRIGEEGTFSLTVHLGDDVATWDEFSPAVYRAEVLLSADDGTYVHRSRIPFGMREIGVDGTRLTLNGRPIFLRGTLECCIFPKTGYPPSDVAEWTRLFEVAHTYGLNHFRFHSYCPPEAAFVAADRMGFMLHVETPVWSHAVGEMPDLDAFMVAEANRIQDTYGNHPSFTMMALGNELGGDWSVINRMVQELKARDPRRLYTSHADHVRMKPERESEFYVTHHTEDGWLRIHLSDRSERPFGTDMDFTDFIQGWDVPTVAHELGQWVVNPDYSELDKYTGPLKPRNLAAFRDQLAERGMLDQAKAMQQASGRFGWLLYKEDMEAAFRTPDFGGFQLLQIQDFPGQGEALIGLLDPFWETKGLFTPTEFRRFCSETVPLLRTAKFTWTAGETFEATAQVNHHGPAPLRAAVAQWLLRGDDGTVLARGNFDAVDVDYGLTTLGRIRVPLSDVRQAQHYTFTLLLEDTDALNEWDLWMYPQSVDTEARNRVLITDRLDDAARRTLSRGGRVLVLSPPEQRGDDHLETRFLPVFWSLSWFPDQPGHNSILCDPGHAALAAFPTDFHSNWQWQELMQPSKAFILDETSPDYRPIVQVVDDYHRNHKLAAVFETRVGAGRLLATGLNLQEAGASRPVARQMLHSLLAYVQSDRFAPSTTLNPSLLERLLG